MDFTFRMVCCKAFFDARARLREQVKVPECGHEHITKNSLAGSRTPCYNGRIFRQDLPLLWLTQPGAGRSLFAFQT